MIRLINSVQAQPILESFHEPIPDPFAAPEVPALSADFPTVMVQPPKRRRWPLFLLGAAALLGGAIGVGYYLGQNGKSGEQGPTATPPQPAAGAAPMLAETDRDTAEQPQPALAQPDVVEQQAEAAVAVTGDVPIEAQPEVAFDAAFDVIVEPAGAKVYLDGKELGPAPLRVGRLAPGAHTLELQAPEGYQSQTIPLELVSGERQVLRLTLDAVQGDAEVAELPEVAEVAEEAPVASSFRTKRPERRVEAQPEKKITRRSEKRSAKKESRKASTSSGSATLMIGSKPPCKIFIDGKDTGLMTPQRSIKVSAGKHKITLVNQQHGLKASATVNVEAGETKRLIKDMSSRL